MKEYYFINKQLITIKTFKMKKLIITTATAITLVFILGFTLNSKVSSTESAQSTNENFKVPQEVKNVLDNSCLQCHGTDGKFKAKMKFNYDKMAEMDNAKLISKLSKIEDMVNEGKMPPKKYIKKNPSHGLSKENKKTITNWASSLAEEIAKK